MARWKRLKFFKSFKNHNNHCSKTLFYFIIFIYYLKFCNYFITLNRDMLRIQYYSQRALKYSDQNIGIQS